MEKLFDKFQEITRWEELESIHEASLEGNSSYSSNSRPQQTVETLQRDSVSLYGIHPKMEHRVYSRCCECEQVFNPRTVGAHKESCPGRNKIITQNLKKKVKSKKKQNSPLPLPPLFKKETSVPPVLPQHTEPSTSASSDVATTSNVNLDVTVSTSKLHENIDVTLGPPSPSIQTNLLTDDDNSSKYKKSKKTNLKTYKEYDPDIHCGVVEGQKGPCTRSITCSNHKIQLRKSVPGRSKDIHVLISEKKAAKDKELRRKSPPRTETNKPNLVADNSQIIPSTTTASSTVITSSITTITTTTTTTTPTTSTITTNTITTTTSPTIRTSSVNLNKNDLHDDNEIDDNSNQLESGYCSIETTVSSTKSSPIIYYNPISPIFVVTPVQKENNMCVETPQSTLSPSLPSGPYFLTIPEQTTNIKYYKSHPKPTVLPTYGARKIGGSILCSNQRLEYQRNDIQMAIQTKRRPTSSNNGKQTTTNPTYNISTTTSPRTILLKTKNLSKVSCKRTSTERIGDSDSKQIRLGTDVNGFILHADMSEVADAPHTCIQENINLLNMK